MVAQCCTGVYHSVVNPSAITYNSNNVVRYSAIVFHHYMVILLTSACYNITIIVQ